MKKGGILALFGLTLGSIYLIISRKPKPLYPATYSVNELLVYKERGDIVKIVEAEWSTTDKTWLYSLLWPSGVITRRWDRAGLDAYFRRLAG